MSKARVTWIFAGAFATVLVGSVIALVAVISGIAGGAVTIGGSQLVTINGAPFAATLAWIVTGSVVISAGALAAIVAWIGALLNTARLEDRTWFVVLLILGLCSFGWLAMIAYIVAGPDSTQGADAPRITAAPAV